MPIKHDADGELYVDALLMDDVELALLFSANRAYFLVDMEVPSAYVDFLRAMLAGQDRRRALHDGRPAESAARTLFFRDFLHHLKHSTRLASSSRPGIKGLVMTRVHAAVVSVRVQGDPRQDRARRRTPTAQKVKQKYALVKHHDRVGRMTDILEYSDVAFPRERFSPELIAELTRGRAVAGRGSTATMIVVRHLYIERRMTPLNLYLERRRRRAARARDARVRRRDRASSPPSTSSPATCCSRTSASRASAASCSTTTTRSST